MIKSVIFVVGFLLNHWLKMIDFGTIRFVFQRRTFWCITLPCCSKFNFQRSLCASVSSPSRVLMGMVGISIEASFNDKNFEVLHVFLLHRVHEKWWKIWDRNDENWSRLLSLSSVFSSTIGQRCLILVPFDLSFKEEHFDALYIYVAQIYIFWHSLYASVSWPSSALMWMGCNSIEASSNEKNFEFLHVFLLQRVLEKLWKIWDRYDENWSRVLSLSLVFSSTIG